LAPAALFGYGSNGFEGTAMKHERIEINPKVMVGKPVIRGTRLTVEHILRRLGAGMTEEQLIEDHPRLTREDIRAALAFAADYMHNDEVIFDAV
jgi:uncharacterized protein (DUF433 family)